MPEEIASRRDVLKTSGAALAAGAGIVGTSQTVAADVQELEIRGVGESPASYDVKVTDPNASGVSSTLESDDEVRNSTTSAICSGTVGPDDVDKYEFEGQVVSGGFFGSFELFVSNSNGQNRNPTLDVERSRSTEVKYRFITTNSASQTSNCESGEEFEADTGYGGFIGGPTGPVSTDDIDTWQLDGVLNYFTAFTGDDEFIKFEQQGF